MTEIEVEFERFVATMVRPVRSPTVNGRPGDGCGSRGRNRRSPRTRSTHHAADLHEREGLHAVTVRRLAADLKIATRTLNTRIGSHGNLIRRVLELWPSKLRLDVRECESWESTAVNAWLDLHQTAAARPRVAELLEDHADLLAEDYIVILIKSALQEGISLKTALDCARSPAALTINDPICPARTMRHSDDSASADVRPYLPRPDFLMTAKWILAGVRQRLPQALRKAIGDHEHRCHNRKGSSNDAS
jgi:AcrR family transcriptional regulator